MELDKKDTKMLQGLSVLAMVYLHLFDRDYAELFTPQFFLFGVPVSFYIAQLSDFCVFGFAFCSGYAHMKQFDNTDYYKRRLKGLLSVLCDYWLILIVFSVISFIVGQQNQMPGSLNKFIMNALTLENSYNGAWWYMFTYIILVLGSPVLMKMVKCWNTILILSIGFLVYCIAYYVRFEIDCSNWFLNKFGPLGMTLFEYLIGAAFYKLRVFTQLYNVRSKLNKIVRYCIQIILILVILYGHTKVVPSLFVSPITGIIVMTLFHFWEKTKVVQSVFVFIGNHSTNIWLTHMFFYSTLFVNFVYIVKYPVLIYLFMMLITILVSMVLQQVEKPLHRIIAQC